MREQAFDDGFRGHVPRQKDNTEYMTSYRRGRERRDVIRG